MNGTATSTSAASHPHPDTSLRDLPTAAGEAFVRSFAPTMAIVTSAPKGVRPETGPPSPTRRRLWLLGLCGVLSPAFLVAATVIGTGIRPDFDHVRHTISELYEVGAPHAGWLMVLFTAYHALVIPFSVGLHRALPGSRRGWIGPAMLGAAGALGIPLGAWARCDPGCFGATTFRGQMHGVLVLLTVPLIYGAMLAIWNRLRHDSAWRPEARYTLVTAIVGIAFGLGMTPFVQGPRAGLLERISVAITLQWYLVMGLRVMRAARRSPGG